MLFYKSLYLQFWFILIEGYGDYIFFCVVKFCNHIFFNLDSFLTFPELSGWGTAVVQWLRC